MRRDFANRPHPRRVNFTMRYVLVAATALLVGCGVVTRDDTARMPNASTGGPIINENEAIALSGWALKDPAATRGNPERAARAIAAEDWLAGQSILYGHFDSYQPGGNYYWQHFRDEVRASVGIAPGTPSQVVVDKMLAAAHALKAGDTAAAAAQFESPDFTLGGQGTLAALSNLPSFPGYGAAYADLRHYEEHDTGGHSYGG